MRINGHTEILPLLGYPIQGVKAPSIYNPYFASAGINALLVPMGCAPGELPALMRSLLALQNLRGILITMPHKVATVDLLDEASVAVQVAGACNAVRRRVDGRVVGDLFDGDGFVRAALRQGAKLQGNSALVVGCGGVGCAIAAALAGAGVARLALFDARLPQAEALAQRLLTHFPHLDITIGDKDPLGHGIVVNATPLGMEPSDPLPLDANRLQPGTFVGEVVMKTTLTPLLRAARARGCVIQFGTDMLYEQIPAYLEFFGLPTTDGDRLRNLADEPLERAA
ncbi:hypothetical protein P3G55_22240 [Leptospira sp. 96542]|nr:hypothetical protein [Leptospira sp. 96542]